MDRDIWLDKSSRFGVRGQAPRYLMEEAATQKRALCGGFWAAVARKGPREKRLVAGPVWMRGVVEDKGQTAGTIHSGGHKRGAEQTLESLTGVTG